MADSGNVTNVNNHDNIFGSYSEVVRNYDNMTEYGKIGQKKYSGIFFEEYEKDLIGKRGIEVYKEMSEGDSIIGAILFAIEMLMRQATWDVEPAGTNPVDKEAAEFIKSCMTDMQESWQDTLSEIMSFLIFGWSYHEICYKRRMGKNEDSNLNSKFNDGLIGWKKIPIRSQDTLWAWNYDENDELVGMTQMPPPNFQLLTIPKSKALHFITKSKKSNPEGRSILRSCYRDWYFKKRLQEIEGIGVERDLAGLPMMTPPEGVDIWDDSDPEMVKNRAYAEKLVQNVRRDALEGIVKPHGWEFELLGSSSKRQFDVGKIIERYDSRIAMTVLADFVLLGHQQVGSFALSSDKTKLFGVALGAFMNTICDVFNTQAIPKLIELNIDHFKGLRQIPRMVHSDIEGPDLNKLGNFIKDMTGVGILVPDENLEQYVRRAASLPDAIVGENKLKVDNTEPNERNKPDKAKKDEGNTIPNNEDKGAKKDDNEALRKTFAKQWVGR